MTGVRNTIEEILSRYTVDPKSGCWPYTGCTTDQGYPVARFDSKLRRVHRLSYEHHVGEIPNGLDLDHTCHNGSGCNGGPMCLHRRCINPDHLEPTDGITNTMRGEAPSARHARKVSCLRGHRYTRKNTYAYRSGRNGRRWKRCRICHNEHSRHRRAAAQVKFAA